MRWNDNLRSDNIRNRRGEGGRSFGAGAGGMGVAFMALRFVFSRFGLGGVALLVGGFFLLNMMGVNLLGGGGVGAVGGGGQAAPGATSRYDEEISAVLASTERVWTDQFARYDLGDYPEPVLNLFSGGIQTQGCGFASSAVGPFYCPGGRQIYIDTDFFDQLDRQLGAPGDFARAYVVAHEVGHHVQTVTGVSDQIRQMQASSRSQADQNEAQVRMELMADCFAGVWASNAAASGLQLEEGDIQEGLRAANEIGDDTLAREAGRRVSPDSFTHGSSEQRRRWLEIGYRSGDMQACDTMSGSI